MTSPAKLSRRDAKAVTRQRLLDAALAILDEEGEGALATTLITRRAGIAQSSFYVHFGSVDDLVWALIETLGAERLRLTRLARAQLRSAPTDRERLRATFRIPLEGLIAHPHLLRLMLSGPHDPSTPLGAWTKRIRTENRDALVEDLIAAGMPTRTESQRRKLEMLADGIIALTVVLAVGHLERRYPDLEEIIDVLVAFSRGATELRAR
jgi:AcrR family transcriptional regulator